MTCRSRLPAILLALLALGFFPVAAHATDPLLSGYAGPGAGEQTILGGGTSGGGDDDGSAAATAQRSLAAPASAATTSSGTITPTPQKPSNAGGTSKDKHKSSAGTKPGGKASSSSSSAARHTGAPRVVAYPTTAGAVSGFPLSAVDVLLVLLGLAALVLATLGLRRAADEPGRSDPPSMPQVSVR